MIIFIRLVLVYLIIGSLFSLMASLGMSSCGHDDLVDKHRLLFWMIIIFTGLQWPKFLYKIIKQGGIPKATKEESDEHIKKVIKDWEELYGS